MTVTLGIIGTAGRGPDASKLTLPLWNDMKRTVYRFVKDHGFTSVISGGSAFSDHLSVGLFNAHLIENLTLALPCQFDWWGSQFLDTDQCGHRLNQLHRQFSQVIGKPTLEEIKTAFTRAELAYGNGFHARNTIVADRADVVIAFTLGEGNRVSDGGSADTCRKYLARGKKDLWHVDLNTMVLHQNATVS